MYAVTGGRVATVTRGTLDQATILIEGGKIVGVGPDLPVPAEARVIDASGYLVTPGLIDAHSHLAVFSEPEVWANKDGNEKTGPVQPHLRGLDSFNPADPAIPDVVRAGITTVFSGPGSANVVGGLGAAYKLRGRTAEEMLIPGTEALKMALGENPKGVYKDRAGGPGTRMGNAGVLREALVKAANYLGAIERAHHECEPGKRPKLPDRDLKLEILGKALRRELKVRIHAHRADDILTAIRISEEFGGLDLVIEHATEGYLVADFLASKGIPCVVGPLLLERHKMELQKVNLRNPALLARAGVKIALQADSMSGTQWLPIDVGLAIREGLPEDEALRAVTINAAEILGLQHRLGSIEAGKDADLVIWSGDPFDVDGRACLVFIDGEIVHTRRVDC